MPVRASSAGVCVAKVRHTGEGYHTEHVAERNFDHLPFDDPHTVLFDDLLILPIHLHVWFWCHVCGKIAFSFEILFSAVWSVFRR